MLSIFFYHNRKYLLLGVYLLFSTAFMISRSEKVNINVKSFINTLISPFHFIINSATKTVNNFWFSIKELNKIKRELVITKNQLGKLQDASIEIAELERENKHLRSILDIKTRLEYDTVYAEIIARDPSNYYSVFVINKGSTHGIERNMPVVTYQHGIKGIVGKILETSKISSKVLPIIGIGSYIGAMLFALRNTGLIRGLGPSEDFLQLDYINKSAILNLGDLVVTSGQGGIYPKGLKIGKIVGFKKVKYGIFNKNITVKPIINLSMLEDVYVILKSPDAKSLNFNQDINN